MWARQEGTCRSHSWLVLTRLWGPLGAWLWPELTPAALARGPPGWSSSDRPQPHYDRDAINPSTERTLMSPDARVFLGER